MNALEDFELRMMDLEERLRPIAQRPVDITKPGWMEKLRSGLPPLDEAGVREDAEKLLHDLVSIYANSEEEIRAAIRKLFVEYRSFAWAATLSVPRTTIDGLRQHLILFSMKDQGRDSRDALLALQEICGEAIASGLDPEPLLREVAAMSNHANKYGMGSTSDLLLKHCSQHGPEVRTTARGQ